MSYIREEPIEQIPAVLLDRAGLTLVPGGAPVEKGSRAIRAGDIVARNTATMKWLVVKYTRLTTALAATATQFVVDDAHPFTVGEVISINGTNKTIDSIDYSTNTIAVVGQLGAAKAINDKVEVTANNVNRGVGVALLPVRDGGGNPGVAPIVGDSAATIALTGRFRIESLLNFDLAGTLHTDLAGIHSDDYQVYIVNNVPATFALT